MFMKNLEKHDFEVLESYWLRFQEISEIKDPKKLHNAQIITKGIEKVYNESTGLIREFIEIRYSGTAKTLEEALYDAEEIGISRTKFKRLRTAVLTLTAKEISWVI